VGVKHKLSEKTFINYLFVAPIIDNNANIIPSSPFCEYTDDSNCWREKNGHSISDEATAGHNKCSNKKFISCIHILIFFTPLTKTAQ
jgi:hypothetical protein